MLFLCQAHNKTSKIALKHSRERGTKKQIHKFDKFLYYLCLSRRYISQRILSLLPYANTFSIKGFVLLMPKNKKEKTHTHNEKGKIKRKSESLQFTILLQKQKYR